MHTQNEGNIMQKINYIIKEKLKVQVLVFS